MKMLRTCFSTAPFADDEALGDREFECPSAISASTSRSRGVRSSSDVGAAAAAEQLRDDLGVDRRAAGSDAPRGGKELVDVGHAVLQQVADAAAAAAQQIGGVALLDVLAEDQNRDLGLAAAQLDRGAHALVGLRRWHPHVDDREVGPMLIRGASSAVARR